MLISSSEIIIGFAFLFFVTSSFMFSFKALWRKLPTKPQLNVLSVSAISHILRCFPGTRAACASGRSHLGPGEASVKHSLRDTTSSCPELVVWPFQWKYHLQLPLLFAGFGRKMTFPRQVCAVVTRRVLLTYFRGQEVQGRVRNSIPGYGLSCPLVSRLGKWVSLSHGWVSLSHGWVNPSHTSFHLSFPPRCKNCTGVTPCNTQLCKGHLPNVGKHKSFSSFSHPSPT